MLFSIKEDRSWQCQRATTLRGPEDGAHHHTVRTYLHVFGGLRPTGRGRVGASVGPGIPPASGASRALHQRKRHRCLPGGHPWRDPGGPLRAEADHHHRRLCFPVSFRSQTLPSDESDHPHPRKVLHGLGPGLCNAFRHRARQRPQSCRNEEARRRIRLLAPFPSAAR